MKEETNIYCDKCGTKNETNSKFCPHCKNHLYPKFPNLRDYLIGKVKDKVKGDVVTTLDKALKEYIKQHLLGITMSIAIVTAGVSTVTTNNHYITKTNTNYHVIDTFSLKGCYHDEDSGRAYNFISKNHLIKYNYEQWWLDNYQGTVHYTMREFNNITLDIKPDGTKTKLILVDKNGDYVRNNEVQYLDGNYIEYLEEGPVTYTKVDCNTLVDLYGKPEIKPE